MKDLFGEAIKPANTIELLKMPHRAYKILDCIFGADNTTARTVADIKRWFEGLPETTIRTNMSILRKEKLIYSVSVLIGNRSMDGWKLTEKGVALAKQWRRV